MRALLILPFLLAATPAVAETREDEQVWFNATLMGSVAGSRLSYFAEVQPRFTDGVSRVGTLILRPAIGWKFSDAVTAYAGYAHVETNVADGPDRNEERVFGQLSWTLHKCGPETVSLRTRLEHRRQSNGGETGWRVRSLLRYATPLGAPERTRALVSVEPFVALNDTDWGARGGFDQVRAFAGVEIPLAGKSTIEAGYLNQYVNEARGDARMNHVLSLTLFVRP
ncbi:MAG: DUF2490 domain-containing protein [Sphingomonas sp.]